MTTALTHDQAEQASAAQTVGGDLIARERGLAKQLLALAGGHARQEVEIRVAFERQRDAIANRQNDDLDAAENRFASAAERIAQERAANESRLRRSFQQERRRIESEARDAIERTTQELDKTEKRSNHAISEARWLSRTVFEAKRKRLKQQLQEAQKNLRARLRAARAIEQEAKAWLARHKQEWLLEAVVDPPVVRDEDPGAQYQAAQTAAEQAWQQLAALRLPRQVLPSNLLWMVAGIAAVLTGSLGWLFAWRLVPWLTTSAILTLAVAAPLVVWLRALARRRAQAVYLPLVTHVREAEECCRRTLAQVAERYGRERREIRQQRDAEVRKAVDANNPILVGCRERRERELPQLAATAENRLAELEAQFERDSSDSQRRHASALSDLEAERSVELTAIETQARAELEANQARYDAARRQWVATWKSGLTRLRAELAAIEDEAQTSSPAWETILRAEWQPAAQTRPAVRIGRLTLDVGEQMGEMAIGTSVAEARLQFTLPALLPQQASLLVKARDAGRDTAVRFLQLVMLRKLAGVAPGKLRFTIVDPVGLGQNFAAFMHLADHDEALITHRIWTEPQHIEQRLTDITAHMETVIQKYLRNEFATIDDYNRQAGEIAEPLRVLVVANYPAGFNEAAARRLASIIESGPRCGVYTLISADTRLPAVPGLDLADLERRSIVFRASANGLDWADHDFHRLPLTLDGLPTTEEFKAILHKLGQAALGAKRVEVPFAAIAPARHEYWQSDSRRGIDIPLGRAGATRLQRLRLGEGTSQHVLIAGKTGSGKSTLLHALVTNAALRYSPAELELYLIDFKKGVEFKTYVTHDLPHARVVAVESEREFGLSVMQRLDNEMQTRGNLFREAGAQDIASYRDQGNQLPRILFIVDEFQEFFVEDDKLAQESALLLDRLVRQGRAFGIHVHLGSQTLGGAYTLARSTLGQMAVRIALQCSEIDAHLILSEDNDAARLLSRPGEAIYNDANGLVEGNHPFQVVWLADSDRERYLAEIQGLAAARETPPVPRVVFEGARPASIEENASLLALLAEPPAESTLAPKIYLGEPLAIDEATSYSFQRRGGANLLWLGQNDEAIAGMATSALVCLLAQLGDDAAIGVLDGSPENSPLHQTIKQLAARFSPRLSHFRPAETKTCIAGIADELAKRQSGGDAPAPRFLFVFDIARLRELRRQDDDFSFSRGSEPQAPRPDRQFSEILREGPPLGVHTLLWCDTLTNFNRNLERQSLREFEARVLLQMSVADSSLLVDSPAAGQLGRYRALLHRDDEGRLEKFRPFAPLGQAWLDSLGEHHPDAQ